MTHHEMPQSGDGSQQRRSGNQCQQPSFGCHTGCAQPVYGPQPQSGAPGQFGSQGPYSGQGPYGAQGQFSGPGHFGGFGPYGGPGSWGGPSGWGRRPFDDMDFFFGSGSVFESDMDRMQRQMNNMRNMMMGQGQGRSGPFDTPFFADSRPFGESQMRDAMGDFMRPFDMSHFGQEMFRHPMDVMRRQMNAMLGPYGSGFVPGFSQQQYALPPQSARPSSGSQQQGVMSVPQDGQMQPCCHSQNADGSSRGQWVTESMEGIWDGDSEPIYKKTRSSFNTDSGVLRRETQKRIGDRTLNVLKTKTIAHPSELTQSLTWDSETRSRPKNDAFTADWKEAKKKLTQGQAAPQHPAPTTHKALFNNMNQQQLNAPKTSP